MTCRKLFFPERGRTGIAVPRNASATEIAAIRHGFYTGAAAIRIMDKQISMEDIAEDEGQEMIVEVAKELGEFFSENVPAGRHPLSFSSPVNSFIITVPHKKR